MFEKINSITFITSESCNLQCSYCEIAKRESKLHLIEAQKIKDSLYSGEYLQAYKTFFEKYNINNNKITKLSIWGQEPTLTLDAFNTQINDILNWLPNTDELFFSTNGVAYVDRIIDLIKILNQYFFINKRKFTLKIQFSFDGIDYIEKQRGVKPEVIINNVKCIINSLNLITLNKDFKIQLSLHGVLPWDNMSQQLEDENNTYWTQNANLIKELKFSVKNKNVHLHPYGAYVVFPYNATKKEGQMYAAYAKYCIAHKPKEQWLISYMSPFDQIINSIIHLKDDYNNKLLLVNSIIDNYNYDYGDVPIFNSDIYRFYGCSPNSTALKMRYNGTLMYCQNTMFNLNEEDLIGKTGIDYDLSYFQLRHKDFYPNVLTDSKEQVENFVNLFLIKEHYPYALTYSTIINLMYLLLQYNQIDESYKNNKEKILRHAFYLARIQECFHAHMIETGSFYTVTLGFLRAYCNGVIDVIEEFLKEQK